MPPASAAPERSPASLSSVAMLTRLFEASPDPITVTDFDSGRLLMVNDGFVRLTGFARDELVGRLAVDVGLWGHGEERRRYIEALSSQGTVNDWAAEFRSRDGRAINLRISATVVREGAHTLLVASMRDVTAQDIERLQMAAILDNAMVGIAFTRERQFQHVNPRFEAMFGWAHGEIIGRPGSAVWPSAEAYAEMGRIAAPVLAGGEPLDMSSQMCRRDGSLFWARIRARAVDPNRPGSGGTIWIVEDITQEREAQLALAAAKEAAESASRTKSEFLANTSHEIRTPLNGLLGLARLALAPGLDPVVQRDYLERIQSSAQALAGVISDILDVSKIEAGQLSIEAVDFDLHALMHKAHGAYAELAAEKGLQFDIGIAAGVPAWVRADAVRLRQIVSSFISNALKFTARGRVSLELACASGDRVRIVVRDTGSGIEPATQDLAVCRRLAELMGGKVGASSEAGRGSLLWAELPLPLARLPSGFNGRSADPAAQLYGARVLLVEDNAVNALVAEATLQQWGAEVERVVGGADALAAVDQAERRGERYDVVLMDLHMPGMSGIDTTRALRARSGGAGLPIVALTADVLVSVRATALAQGMNDFLAKPIEPARLVEVLARWVKLGRAGRLG
jgi:PAS domain S-box-containing protein